MYYPITNYNALAGGDPTQAGVTLYADAQGGGAKSMLIDHNIPDFRETSLVHNDRASSIYVPPGWEATVFQHNFYGGNATIPLRSVPNQPTVVHDLGFYGLNDQASSIKVKYIGTQVLEERATRLEDEAAAAKRIADALLAKQGSATIIQQAQPGSVIPPPPTPPPGSVPAGPAGLPSPFTPLTPPVIVAKKKSNMPLYLGAGGLAIILGAIVVSRRGA